MGHDHGHHNHPHSAEIPNSTAPYIIGILLNLTFVAIEFIYGFLSHSLGLMADAWHNLGDVAGLGISLLAIRMAALKPNSKYTYGFSKGTILASLANSVLLLIAVGSIGYEAFQRFLEPQTPEWGTISIVAGIGIGINTATAFLFFNKNELNSRAAFLHMAADALVSIAVVIAGFLIHFTGLAWIDPAVSLLICAVILSGTWKLMKNSLRLSLDGVPVNMNMDEIRHLTSEFPEIKDIHHLHVWAISTTKNALTAHILVKNDMDENAMARLRSELKHRLLHLNIQHATLELETQHTADAEECDNC